jgi:hypothetical protein
MRERDGLAAESRYLGLTFDREHPQVERENGQGDKVRKIILAAGLDYPRYDRTKDKKRWILRAGRTGPDLHKDDHKGRFDKSGCLTAADRKLKADADVLTGSLWRMRCLRLASLKLHADPDAQVYLYDFLKGVEERLRIEKGKLTAEKIRTFLPIVSEDYRRIEVIKTKDPKGGKDIVRWNLKPVKNEAFTIKDHPERPSIRYFPFISTLDKGDVDYHRWLREIAANSAWLAAYVKKKDAQRLMSITDVYYHVEYIGRHNPYVLHELHLLGHASSSAQSMNSGTAFVNTDHINIKGRTGRHPLDLDARATLDFAPPTINPTLFRMAFAKGATGFVWGCNWDRPLKSIIEQAAAALGSRPLKDDSKFKFKWRDEGTHGHKEDFQKLLTAPGATPTTATTIEVTGKFLRELLLSKIDATYMQRLADASAHCVSGGFPGVYSEYDDKPEKGAPCLLHIPMGGPYFVATVDKQTGAKSKPVNLLRILTFYADKMGRSFNRDGAHAKFGRGFGLYCPRP